MLSERSLSLVDGSLDPARDTIGTTGRLTLTLPAAVTQLKEAIVGADGVLLVTPEYNNGIPGVFKNAIDWLSRPSSDVKRVFGGRPFALIGASPGQFGTTLSQAAWLPVLRTLGTQAWSGGRLMVPRAASVFDGMWERNQVIG